MLFLGAIKILPLVTQDNVEHGLCPIRRPVHPGTLKAVINKVAALPLNFHRAAPLLLLVLAQEKQAQHLKAECQ
jgi:hypothetical protein